MLAHDQWLLMLAIACLYIYDSSLLLFHNELVMESIGDRYVVSGGCNMELRGRHVFVPNPLLPHRALARLSWPQESASPWRPSRWKRSRLALRVIAPWTWILWATFFVALPLLLFVGTSVSLLIWLVVTYLTILGMMWQTWRLRKVLGLTTRDVWALALDAALCAPFAMNLVRKISIRQSSPTNLHSFADSLLDRDDHASLVALLRERIGISLVHVDPDSEANSTLNSYLDRFKEKSP
jgi:hypothetical protein